MLSVWSLALGLGWLLPNHYGPWNSFHFDAWISLLLLVIAFAVVAKSSQTVDFHRMAVVVAFLVPAPFFHYWAGLLPFAGQAWMGTNFLVGLLLALVFGAYWEKLAPSQGIDGLFLAIGFAAVISVGQQLFQWLSLTSNTLDLWIMAAPASRPFANFIQPNQLATFLLWGILACAWGVVRRQIAPGVAVLAAAYLLFGVALTHSRTAFFAVLGLGFACYFWRNVWQSKTVNWCVAGLLVYFLICVAGIPLLAGAMDVENGPGLADTDSGNIRLAAYRLFVDAALQRPFFGYGWSQTVSAQLAVAESHEKFSAFFLEAHNLFFDLLLWFGIPIGGLLSLAVVFWFAGKARRVGNSRDVILVLFVGVVGWHAMLEYPLHYAYMLLPTGLVAGTLNARLDEPVMKTGHRWQLAVGLMLGLAMFIVTTRDYLRIEENYRELLFERARIGPKPTGPPASVWALGYMNEFIRLGRTTPKTGMRAEELESMDRASRAYPSPANLFTLASALAMNQKIPEAQKVINRLSKVTSDEEFIFMQRVWSAQTKKDAALGAVRWPQAAVRIVEP